MQPVLHANTRRGHHADLASLFLACSPGKNSFRAIVVELHLEPVRICFHVLDTSMLITTCAMQQPHEYIRRRFNY